MRGIYFITDSLSILKSVIHTGIGAVQLRDKDSVDFKRAKKMQLLCSKYHIPFIINDRVDLALLLNADGVHLGQSDFPVDQARMLLGKHKIIGATASNFSEIAKATEQGADYIGLGHIYPTPTKEKKRPPLGIDTLERFCKQSSIPLFAIGGIQSEHILKIKETGVKGIAICSAISHARSPSKAATQLVHLWNAISNI